ncbi:MAG: TetR/AcrR family transcriptional regulator [Firmicutes bacterium]|nr:TetR/AcrR family transcriptional regulator [Bacillota bacterium]
MGRPRRSPGEVEQSKRRILDAALELFNSLTYDQVSMRKVAARAGCSPATIYNYYRNKDALYLDVLKTGFEILLESFRAGVDLERPRDSVREMIRRLHAFSRDYPTYYDLMFTLPVPKYLDYVGTDMEQVAWDEKTVAIANLSLAEEVIRAGVGKGEFPADVDPPAAALTLLAAAHGVISLERSGVLAEVGVEGDAAYATVMEQVARGVLQEPGP